MVNNNYISYKLNDKETKFFVNNYYGIDSKRLNKEIGKMIVKVINSFEIKKDRECFYSQRVKDLTVKSISQNSRYGSLIKIEIGSNYVHQMIKYQINNFLLYRSLLKEMEEE